MNTTDEQTQILDACRAHLPSLLQEDALHLEMLILKRHGSSGLTVQQLPVPETLWTRHLPDQVIGLLADAATRLGVTASAETAAIALTYDALVVASDTTPQAAEVLRRRAAGGSIPRIEDVPGHVRWRCISAIDRHGRHYLVSGGRNGDGSLDPGMSMAISDSGSVSGAAADALSAFAGVIWPEAAEGRSGLNDARRSQ